MRNWRSTCVHAPAVKRPSTMPSLARMEHEMQPDQNGGLKSAFGSVGRPPARRSHEVSMLRHTIQGTPLRARISAACRPPAACYAAHADERHARVETCLASHANDSQDYPNAAQAEFDALGIQAVNGRAVAPK